jgi:hypothetical protein
MSVFINLEDQFTKKVGEDVQIAVKDVDVEKAWRDGGNDSSDILTEMLGESKNAVINKEQEKQL